MAQILLFHSVLGIREGVRDAASRMETMGHTVHVPDLYGGGRTFDQYEPAMAYVDQEVTYPVLLQRTREAAAALPADLVYAGFSNGGASAEYLAATRPGARGLILFAAAMPTAAYAQIEGAAVAGWPAGVPVQVHYTAGDPFREQDALDAFEREVMAAGAPFTLHEYPGSGHLFTDPSLPNEYDADSAELLWERVEAFLEGLR